MTKDVYKRNKIIIDSLLTSEIAISPISEKFLDKTYLDLEFNMPRIRSKQLENPINDLELETLENDMD